MLLLLFHLGSQQYALAAKQIIEILPLTTINAISRTPDYIAGLLDYRGRPVPIIDLCQLTNGNDYRRVLSSRIVLVNYTAKDRKIYPLGLIAEKVTETINISQQDFTSSGLAIAGLPFLGSVTNNNGNMIQYVEINELLTDELQQMLFTQNANSTSERID